MIDVVLFDLDDTLFAHRAAVDAGILAHLTTVGAELDDAATRWHQLEELHYPRYLTGELGFLQQRRIRVRELVAPLGIDLSDDRDADDWYAAYYHEYVRAWALHDDALPCLDVLASRGIRTGIITNGELDFQTDKLTAVALLERMEHVIASGDVGVAKPDPEIFRIAVRRFDVPPGRAAYVGDRLRTDAMGACDAGLLGVWLDRHDSGGDFEPRIRSLAQLPGLL